MEDSINLSELMRFATLLEHIGHSSDEILKMFKYVESGNDETLNEIVKQCKAENDKDK